jgi:alkylation response protein AidB-like acyl-CoA dehydrogenase
MSSGHSPAFSKKLAERGWVGMALPVEYGGHGRPAVERFVVSEELLASGAPVAAHWTADRQTGPTILRYGNQEQRRRFLPPSARGDSRFSLGKSEPDSGSDLASVRTSATKVAGGWSVSGTKIWTTYAHLNHFAVVLCRTSPAEGDRHRGLSQLIVDLRAPGVSISTIPFLDGTRDFAEVVLDEVFVADDDVLGEVGNGWSQVTSELAFERAGPDRYLSTWQVFEQFVGSRAEASSDARTAAAVGRVAAKFWAIRQMSLSVAASIDAGRVPAVEAALVKDIGTSFEQEVVEIVRGLSGVEQSLDDATGFGRLLAMATLNAPSFTVRGGTSEILRAVAARRMTPRD